MIAEKIVQVATDYAHAGITEIQQNRGFTDKQYQKDIASVGWWVGAEWCAFSSKLDWKKGYADNTDIWNYVNKLLTGNAQESLRNCHNDKIWPTGLTPKPGCLVVWGLGDSTEVGHMGTCLTVSGNQFTTSEGNTSSPAQPSIRNGWTKAIHTHTIGQPHSVNGLNFIRCIYVLEQLPN